MPEDRPALSSCSSGPPAMILRIPLHTLTRRSTTLCKYLDRLLSPSLRDARAEELTVHPALSPSVYMLIDTIYGYNSAGRVGPSATSTIFALDLDEVSTIVTGSNATHQLTLSDLSTDCPQSADPSAIATMAPGGRCDPVLAAPNAVKSWASPCGACGPFWSV